MTVDQERERDQRDAEWQNANICTSAAGLVGPRTKDPTIEAGAGLSALAWISLALDWIRERQKGMRRRNTRNEDLDPFARHPQPDGIKVTSQLHGMEYILGGEPFLTKAA